ncbi:MAG: hypothetical protein ACTTIR_07395 [Eggerthia catenaformis]|uniref:hypothetical protein n=1 Tax=Eggerthia catenaformis TaxID=31973 RepID=UPI003F9FD42F
MLISKDLNLNEIQNVFIKNFMEEENEKMLNEHLKTQNNFYERKNYFVYYNSKTGHCKFYREATNIDNYIYVGMIEITYNLGKMLSCFHLEI